MITLFLAAALAVQVADDPAAAISSHADRIAAHRCAARLAARAGGDLLAITVDRTSRIGSRATIRGTINIGQRPVPGPPGTLTPAHIVDIPFRYRCSLHHGRVVKTAVSPLGA